MKIYIAGPMRGIPFFNFPLFHEAAASLRADGHEVFNPAERDIADAGTDISVGNPTGSEAQAAADHGIDIRDCLEADTRWICRNAECVVALPGWQQSKGAVAELALARALGLEMRRYKMDGAS